MLAQHSYPAQGPGDLEFSKGDVLDILSEGSSPVLSTGSLKESDVNVTEEWMTFPVLFQVCDSRRCRPELTLSHESSLTLFP